MSLVKVQGNAAGTGTLTIAAPNTNTNRTLTLPDDTGTLISTGSTFAGTGPAFSAYASGTTTVSHNINTKILFAAEEFDTNNNFASSTFTPTVAGYYQINASAYSSNTTGAAQLLIYKNGSIFKGGQLVSAISAIGAVTTASSIISLNGSTDYVDIYLYQNSGTSSTVNAQQAYTWFQGAMVRAA